MEAIKKIPAGPLYGAPSPFEFWGFGLSDRSAQAVATRLSMSWPFQSLTYRWFIANCGNHLKDKSDKSETASISTVLKVRDPGKIMGPEELAVRVTNTWGQSDEMEGLLGDALWRL